jgi:hypothetical protein
MISRLSSALIFASLFTSTPILKAQDFIVAQNQTEERPAGLLALPEIFGEYPCERFEAKKLDLYATPLKQRPPIATIERLKSAGPADDQGCVQTTVVVRRLSDNSTDTLPTDESGYEEVRAVVYQQSGNWFRIAIPHGSGWVERRDSRGYLSYPEQLSGESFLSYIRPGWDGKIWTNPSVGAGIPAPAAWVALSKKEIPVRVVSTQTVKGEKWVQVVFEKESCAVSLGNNLPDLQVWLPAYRSSRETSIWFYSRGC